MKNIFKTFIAAVLVTGFVSCDEDQDLKFLSPDASFTILTPQSGEGVVLSPATTSNPGLVLTWTDMDYGTPTQVTYTVEAIANGSTWENPIAIATTTNTFISIDSGTLNNAALAAGLPPFTAAGMDIRIKSSIGAPAAQDAYSNVITYIVTSFSNELPRLAVVGNHQGWAPDAADVPELASAGFGQTNYEGWVWLDGEYKFLMPDGSGNYAWGNTDYGDDGTFTGMLKETDEVNAMAAAPGYYLVRANTGLLTYSATMANWGIIGSATPTGWDSDTDMVWDPATQTWSVTMDLLGGQFIKFRANDDWGLNYGDNGADGSAEEGGSDIPVANGGNYTITLDLSNPRAYTYTLQQN